MLDLLNKSVSRISIEPMILKYIVTLNIAINELKLNFALQIMKECINNITKNKVYITLQSKLCELSIEINQGNEVKDIACLINYNKQMLH